MKEQKNLYDHIEKMDGYDQNVLTRAMEMGESESGDSERTHFLSSHLIKLDNLEHALRNGDGFACCTKQIKTNKLV